MTCVHAVRDAAFKKCCVQSGTYDGSRRNYFFPQIELQFWRRALTLRVAWRTSMHLRFVVTKIDEDSERALGVFHAVWNLRDAGMLYPYEQDHHDVVRGWFNTNLEAPTRFTAAKTPFYRKKNRALCWFKDTAVEHIAQVRELVATLENHDGYVRTLKAKRVGYVVYEDEYQVAAEPFADLNC